MKRLLILHTAPLEQISYTLEKIREKYPQVKVTCVCQTGAAKAVSEVLSINDFIPYAGKFFKIYYMLGLVKKIKTNNYEGIAFFYNNVPRLGYAHLEWFCFLSGVKNIIFGDENGGIEVLSRLAFFYKAIIIKYIRWIGNVLTLLAILSILLVVWLYVSLRRMVNFFGSFS